MGRFGVDYAWGYRPGLENDLRAAGVTFAARYISTDASKDETLAEAKALAADGIDSVLVFETTAKRAEDGYQAGVDDATLALKTMLGLLVPSDRPCYWAVDEDTTLGPHITAYAQGWEKVLSGRHGPYGSYDIVKAVLDHGLARWAWQTYAWSAGLRDPRAKLYQYSNGHTIGGVSCDYDTAFYSDFGQWRPAVPQPKPPAPRPPAPRPPLDVEGPWPYSPSDYLGVRSSDVHCHSGYFPRDRAHVAAFQHQLQVRGWRIVVDGDFGTVTQGITRAFQKDRGITVDGKAGQETWNHARHDPVT